MDADCTITINGKRKGDGATSRSAVFRVKSGSSLLFALWSKKVFVPSICGGQARCGACKVQVVKGGGERLASEEPLLTAEEKSQGFRLACQVQVTGDIEILVPEKLLGAGSKTPS